jgi:hypothetical protein
VPFASIHLTAQAETRVSVEPSAVEDRLVFRDGRQHFLVAVALTPTVKDQLERAVQDWTFAEEAALRAEEAEKGYPVGQTLSAL